jgi:Tfp pilus assembly protein PilF
VQGKVYSQWADLYLAAGGPQNLMHAQPLLVKAATLSPSEPAVFASMGMLFAKAQKFDLATKMLDQALMLDPANWKALWGKFQVLESQGRTAEMKQVADALRKSYPQAPKVLALSKTPVHVGGKKK